MLPASKISVPRLCLTTFRLARKVSRAQASTSGRTSRTALMSVASAISL